MNPRSNHHSTAVFGGPKGSNLVVNAGATGFITGDHALFDDAGNPSVRLNVENVTPVSEVFDNRTARSYTLGGPFKVTGTTRLAKTRKGPVTISNTNSFTRPVRIATGIVRVNAVAPGSAALLLGGLVTLLARGRRHG